MENPQTLDEMWKDFSKILPKDAMPVQRREMELAFKSGMFAMLSAINDLVREGPTITVQQLKTWDAEYMKWTAMYIVTRAFDDIVSNYDKSSN